MEQQLITATWGLVAVTALLVLATLIPFVGDLLRRREERSIVAARTVPDLNILRSRLEGAVDRLADPQSLEKTAIERQERAAGGELEMLAPIIQVREASLKFTNELFILRHLLTFCRHELHAVAQMFESNDGEVIRQRDEKIRAVRRTYKAAVLTLDAAEMLLPAKQRTIDGDRFWDRFARVSDERENEAAQLLLQDQRVDRTSRRAPT